ncbi:MAG TPA: hypothetical protein PLD62_04880 [Candidatus Cloacimonadota bacterium]|nr:hypothetical protein [Candidatus Cloacimonadota bacterium]
MLNKLRSENGFGLISVVTAALIVAISIAGLFMASYITQHKALSTYHYRAALLKGAQKLEEVKYKNRSNTSRQPVNIEGIASGIFTLDELSNGHRITGKIHPITVKRKIADIAVGNNVFFDKVYVRITWYDGPRLYLYKVLNKQKMIILREDYFYQYVVGQ